jgi:penicillin-binding protein 1A
VLKEMRQQGYLSPAQYQAALAQRLVLDDGHRLPPGATVVYPNSAPPTAYPDFVDYVTRWLLAHFPASEVYGGGLRVQTTLDPTVQADAYAAVRATLSGTSPPLDMAMAVVEPSTGFVPALVGGRGFGSTSQVNLALGGCDPRPAAGATVQVAATCWSGRSITGGGAGRQPGSAWKPFTLATAFEQGIQPGTTYWAPGVYQSPGCKLPAGQPASACQIHNDEPGSIIGTETLAQATVESTNTVYAQVAPQVGCNNVAATAQKLGIESAYYSTPPFYYCQGYALGEVDVSPLDMASAYGVFADHGQRAPATPILEIVNGAGKILVNNISPLPATTQVLPANVADNVTNVLQGVISGGTGTAARLGRPAAGKTGTTSNYTNAWFVGYTPTLSAAVWMGNASSQGASMGNVKGVEPVYGGTWPAITWQAFMTQALAGVAATPFTEPAPIVAPHAAPVLQAAPTTTLPVQPGPAGVVQGTPQGGPYQVPPPTFGVPEPVTTTVPPPTTTAPPPPSTSTTSTTAPTRPGGSTTTTSPSSTVP